MIESNKERIEIFPITIFKSRINDNTELKNLISSKMILSSNYLKIPSDWATNNIKTSFKSEVEGFEIFSKDSPYLKMVRQRYTDCMLQIFDRDFSFIINKIWYNVYSDGEYQEDHDHLAGPFNPSHFSCIHFLSFDPEQHSPPEFKDPLAQLRNLSVEFESNRCGEIYVPKVKEGDLLMFPSYLTHRVLPCKKTDYPRITISFNITVLSYGNKDD